MHSFVSNCGGNALNASDSSSAATCIEMDRQDAFKDADVGSSAHPFIFYTTYRHWKMVKRRSRPTTQSAAAEVSFSFRPHGCLKQQKELPCSQRGGSRRSRGECDKTSTDTPRNNHAQEKKKTRTPRAILLKGKEHDDQPPEYS